MAEFDMDDNGISILGDVVDLGVQTGVIVKSGSFFKYQDSTLAQGREAVKTYLSENPTLVEQLKKEIWQAIKPSETAKE
jgi:recombination protein RecA